MLEDNKQLNNSEELSFKGISIKISNGRKYLPMNRKVIINAAIIGNVILGIISLHK